MSLSKWQQIANSLYENSLISENLFFTREEIEEIALFQGIIAKIPMNSRTWTALFSHNVLIEDNHQFKLIYEKKEKSTKNDKAVNEKADNQYYGKYFEKCISAVSKGITIAPDYDQYVFSEEEKQNFMADAAIAEPFIDEGPLDWTGNHTMSDRGDLRTTDGRIIEVKRLSNNSNGTYFNGTIRHLEEYGFFIHDYFNEEYYQLLEKYYGPVNRNGMYPVTVKRATAIRESGPDSPYETIIKPYAENIMRKLTDDVYTHFINNPQDCLHFILKTFGKEKINKHSSSGIPDRFICFNYITKQLHEVDLKKIRDNITALSCSKTEKGISIDNLRFQFSWKNGYGLNNLAIYVFIKGQGE